MPDIEPALRELVRVRAAGLCEYCRISERFTLAEHEIDRVIALKHGGQTIDGNLALCCAVCNRYKGSDIASIDPESGQLTPLFHPRVDRWDDHYRVRNGEIVALTAPGRLTVRLLRMNSAMRVRERQLMEDRLKDLKTLNAPETQSSSASYHPPAPLRAAPWAVTLCWSARQSQSA